MDVPQDLHRSESCRFDPIHITLIMTCPNMLVTDLRKQTSRLLKASYIASEDTYDIEVIVSELVTNATVHARAKVCSVNIDIDSSCAVITVADDGGGFKPDNILAPGARRSNKLPCFTSDASKSRVGGYGLPLVRLLSDSLDVVSGDEGGTTIRVTKSLRRLPA